VAGLNLSRIVGACLIASPFVAFTFALAHDQGWMHALLVWAGAIVVVFSMVLGIALWERGSGR
jgi:hypothetical protein